MESIATLMLGASEDRSRENAKKLAARAFPEGALLVCGACGRSATADISELAKAIMGDWPRCCGAKMNLDGTGPAPRTVYAIVFEALPHSIEESVRVRRLLKLAGRHLALRCLRVEERPDFAN